MSSQRIFSASGIQIHAFLQIHIARVLSDGIKIT